MRQILSPLMLQPSRHFFKATRNSDSTNQNLPPLNEVIFADGLTLRPGMRQNSCLSIQE